MPRVSKFAIWTLYMVVFVDLFQVSFVFPFIPTIVTSFYSKDTPNVKDKISSSVAILSSLAAVGEMVGSPILGYLSDKFGRRPVLLVSTLGSAGSGAMLAYSHSLPVAAIARIVNGLSGGTGGIANTYLVDVTDDAERPPYMSTLTACVGIGLAVGPIVGGWLYLAGGVEVACLSAAGVSVLNFIFIFLFIKETNPNLVAAREALVENAGVAEEAPPAPAAAASVRSIESSPAPRKLPTKIWVLFCASFFQTPIFVVFDTFSNLYVTEKFYNGDEQKGTLLFSHCMALAGVCLVIVPLFIYRPFLRLVGFNASIFIGCSLIIVGLVFNGLAPKDWMFLGSSAIWALGFQLAGPVVPILVGRLAPPALVGSAFGLFNSFGNASRVIGPAALTPLYNLQHDLVFFFLAISMCVVCAIYLFVASTTPPKPQADARPEPNLGEEGVCSPARRTTTMSSTDSRYGTPTSAPAPPSLARAVSPSATQGAMAVFCGMPEQIQEVENLLINRFASARLRSVSLTEGTEPPPAAFNAQRSQTVG
mmetsp:Transcript_81882/g.171281  ORF Transcript_81882/g.171281 Transcript_81882/m.171281 type:complete len:535 (+) Transcript_81882:362-1966(+)|eukprot:CAMPEP_0206448968 /NCGR_PEP_ID=MMETSP0324_2-20121206/17807_1 /ASSEMBLY_ACC=CAM_ASM_000836 /TAXON_ID=2866 /ORGANISM="Crypthecodinium cohnii, Strain Seligo" /LENGTH=534 /DNA_ID=CAMNT_0053918251 /DNA_START=277 /DNA_END=1881 /DNA_ORIENTATION=+